MRVVILATTLVATWFISCAYTCLFISVWLLATVTRDETCLFLNHRVGRLQNSWGIFGFHVCICFTIFLLLFILWYVQFCNRYIEMLRYIWIVMYRIDIAEKCAFFHSLIYVWPLIDLTTVQDIFRRNIWILSLSYIMNSISLFVLFVCRFVKSGRLSQFIQSN